MTPPGQPVKVRRGCMFYGCIVGVVFMLMVLAGLLAGMHYAKKMINEFTDSKSMELPAPRLSSAEVEQVRQRVNTFKNSTKDGTNAQPLILTGDEINALVATDPEMKAVKGKMYVTLEGDKIKALVSVPMDEIGLPFFRKRFLNGDAVLTTSLRDGFLRIHAEDIRVKGKSLPVIYMDKIKKQNWAEGFMNDPNASAALQKLQSLEVKDGKLIITPATGPPKSAPPQ